MLRTPTALAYLSSAAGFVDGGDSTDIPSPLNLHRSRIAVAALPADARFLGGRTRTRATRTLPGDCYTTTRRIYNKAAAR